MFGALIVGHSKEKQGASNKMYGTSEYQFNSILAEDIKTTANTHLEIVYRNSTYRQLIKDVNKLSPNFAVSLHGNSFNTTTSGTEVLYHPRSKDGKRIAATLQLALLDALGLNDRGIRSRGKGRGALLLSGTYMPAVIAEPFFIDNNVDFQTAIDNYPLLVHAYANALDIVADALQNGVKR